MYCPVCLNNSLKISSRGVVHLRINGKQMDTGRFLYNIDRESKEVLLQNFRDKIEEFFRWYSSFQNIKPIQTIDICSSDYICENGCIIPVNKKCSVIDVLLSKKIVKEIFEEFGEKYRIEIELEFEET